MTRPPSTNTFSLHDAFDQLQQELEAKLRASAIAFHPDAKGDNAELNWVAMLRDFLPQRYCVDPAFIIDVNGDASEQIDIAIYDSQYSPLLFRHAGSLYIPAESVYAVLEVKPELSKTTIEYAGKKIASVRRLQRTSANIPHAGGEFDAPDPKRILGGLVAARSAWKSGQGKAFRQAINCLSEEHRLDLGSRSPTAASRRWRMKTAPRSRRRPDRRHSSSSRCVCSIGSSN